MIVKKMTDYDHNYTWKEFGKNVYKLTVYGFAIYGFAIYGLVKFIASYF